MEEGDAVRINTSGVKASFNKGFVFLRQKKTVGILVIIALIAIIILSSWIRTADIPGLKDVTTGEYTLGPDLDPFLYLRHAEEINSGTLENPDTMRYAPLGSTNYALKNLMPWAIFILFRIMSIFSDVSITYSAIILPVVLFSISIIGFFLFNYALFSIKFSKRFAIATALLASLLYAILPSILHRTVAGVPEIESLGLMWLWFAFFFFILAWRNEKRGLQITYAVIAGILTGLMSWSWGGYRYIYMTIGVASLIFFIFEKEKGKNLVVFSSWIIPALLFEFVRIGAFSPNSFRVSDTGLAFFVLFVMIIDLVLFKTKLKEKLKIEKIKLPQSIVSLIIGVVLIILVLLVISPEFLLGIIPKVIEGFLYPFGKGRVGATIAENKPPYLLESISAFGNIFWLFLIGMIILFWDSLEHIGKKKRIFLSASFIILILGVTLTRISEDHILNGENFISQLLYLGSIGFFLLFFLYTFIKFKLDGDEQNLEGFRKMDIGIILILVFSFFALISMRGAIRLFFIVSLVVVILSSFVPIRIARALSNKNKEDLTKLFLAILLLISVVVIVFTGISYFKQTSSQAEGSIPGIYEQQWQKAMLWVRENTSEGSIFTHWWDYGYWVQTLGKRPTVSDGGHFIGYWDHLVGRYLLTTQKPETALSFMKTHNVSYLLIDSTDLGKYGAYSSIGSDSEGVDRFSQIPTMILDPSNTKESADKETRIYVGGVPVDEDIVYSQEGKEIFLPANKAFIGATILELSKKNGQISFNQPHGIFIYNNQQISIPLRYLYLDGRIIDFGSGLSATARIVPSISFNEQGLLQMDNLGTVIYLSQKVSQGLFAQLYLMDDPFNNYPTLKIAHSEADPLVESLNNQGANIQDFVYYQGFRGSIKIWRVDYPDNIIKREEFLKTDGAYAEMDNLTFIM